MRKIKFYSEYDMACGNELNKIIEFINNDNIDIIDDINNLLEIYNISKYLNFEIFKSHIKQYVHINLNEYQTKIKKNINIFINKNKENILKTYSCLEVSYRNDFFDIITYTKIYNEFKDVEFEEFLKNNSESLFYILLHEDLIKKFNKIIKNQLMCNPKNVEIIINKYLNNTKIYLPLDLSENDIILLLNDYINSPDASINYLRDITLFPSNKGFIVPDRIKLSAKRRENKESEKIFSENNGLSSCISIKYLKNKSEPITYQFDSTNIFIEVSQDWIEENLDYPTLWNNFIYIFNFVDNHMILTLDSKDSEIGTLESLILPNGEHIYVKTSAFTSKELYSDLVMYTYDNILNIYNKNIESMIEWFFNVYLADEFNINNFIIKLPSKESTYFEKCRIILPEIDRIFKQYNCLVEDGIIDQELIQISSTSFKFKDIKSLNRLKYVYPNDDWCKIVFFLLFSDQCMLCYLPDNEYEYDNFFDLIMSENIKESDIIQSEQNDLEWLTNNNIIEINRDGYIKFTDINLILILRNLYNNKLLSYLNLSKELRLLVDNLVKNNHLSIESSLLSRNEQDYLDFYLNKTKFTNGYDLRNSYLHGTNTNDIKKYEADYFRILKLFVIIILKINDDIICFDNKDK